MKKGFTLAEILVSMGIIGVVAAMTIPSLVSEHKKQVYASQLSTIVSNVENAFTSMMAAEGTESLSDTEFGSALPASNIAYTAFSRYYKTNLKELSLTSIYGNNNPFKLINGTSSSIGGTVPAYYITKNGAMLAFDKSNYTISETLATSAGVPELSSPRTLVIDVNGKENPNVFGRDVFVFAVGDDGLLYPGGSKMSSLLLYGNANNTYKNASGKMACTKTVQSRNGCAARLIENGYKMDY